MKTNKLIAAMALVCGSLLASTANANLISWSISGDGSPTATQVGTVTDLNYNAYGYGFTHTFNATGLATEDGDYTFNWDYSGFHSWFLATASLYAGIGGPTDTLLPTSGVSGGFDVSGIYTFSNVHAGDVLDFTFDGFNYDSTAIVAGDLHLEQTSGVPEPASLALLGLGIAGLVVSRRRSN